MKYIYIVLILVSSSSFANTALDGRYVKNEVLVTYKNSRARLNAASMLREQGFSPKVISKTNIVKLKITTSVGDAIKEFSGDTNVLAVQPNYIYHITNTTPNDAQYGQQWSLKNTGQLVTDANYTTNNPGNAGDDLSMEKVWDVITDCSSVTVAVIDSGVNYNHNDLKNNMWNDPSNNHGYNFVDDDNDPMDLNGHGTHVAGAIAAEGNNSIGVVGVCWKATVMAIKVMGIDGYGSTENIIRGVNYAVANGAKVINMSLGGSDYDPAFKSAIDSAQTAGVLVVVAAGNDNLDVETTPMYPCSYNSDNIVCVAAVDQKFVKASFSNFGATSVDVAAPGTNILSTLNGNITSVLLNDPGWNLDNAVGSLGWGHLTINSINILANPSTWDGTNTYSAHAEDVSYIDLGNMTGADSVIAEVSAAIDLDEGHGYFNINYKAASGNPFTVGTQLDSISYKEEPSDVGHKLHNEVYQLTSCANQSNCSIGFKLTSSGGTQYTGVALAYLYYTKMGATYNDELCLMNGTSMASPYVAGLATLLFAYNPNFTYADVKSAIMNGGKDSSTLTVSNKVINGWGSLTYIHQPTGLTLTVSQ